MEFDLAFGLAELTLLFAPPAMLGVFLAFRESRPHRLKLLTWGSAGLLSAVIVANFAGVSFINTMLNFLSVLCAYAAYCFLAASCLRIRPIYLRILAFLLGVVPVICLGYLLSTIGALGLMFIVGDFTRAPSQVTAIGPGLTRVVSDWGMAGNEGQDTDVYRTWVFFPFIKYDVSHKRVDDSDPN